jgi:hypothetical protein
MRSRGRGGERIRTSIKTAFIASFCATAGKGDVSITRVFVDTRALGIQTADK